MEPALHSKTRAELENLLKTARGSYLLHGDPAASQAAIWLASRLVCPGTSAEPCSSCLQAAAGNHPDILLVTPADKSIGIAQIHELQQKLSLRPYYTGSLRVAVITPADVLTDEAQNSLLKTLEEPPPGTVIVLAATAATKLLPTVLSRCMKIFIEPDTASHPENELAQELTQTSLFNRLRLAAELAEKPEAAAAAVTVLTSRLRRELREGTGTGRELVAIERFWRYRESNVPLKAALESLVLEL